MTDVETDCHPLDGTDASECYQTMMAERTALITARQDAENTLVRTIIQLASALIVLIAGFVTQGNFELSVVPTVLFSFALAGMVIAIIAGLFEHLYSSKAYLSQQKLVEAYFSKEISDFDEPAENKTVRWLQKVAFFSFTVGIVLISILAIVQVGGKLDVRSAQRAAAASTPSAASAAASTPSTPSADARQ